MEMMLNIRGLVGCVLDGRDGIVGEITSFYFDDRDWIVRYALVGTVARAASRQVFVPPCVFQVSDWCSGIMRTDLTREQIKRSPAIDVARPLSRRQEMAIIQYYEMPVYWRMAARAAVSVSGFPGKAAGAAVGYPALHSTREIFGCPVKGRDGEIGVLEDLLIDEVSWAVIYAVVNTGVGAVDRKVLLPPRWVERVDRGTPTVCVALARQTVTQSPAYDPLLPVTRIVEEKLFDYYGFRQRVRL
jgi:hypothetical protein